MEEDKILPKAFDTQMYIMTNHISGLRTGYYELDTLLSGCLSSEYIIVGYFNPEDANDFISNNISASNRSGTSIAIFSLNKATYPSIADHKKSIVVHDCESIFDLRKRARYLVRENDIKALIIDDITKLNCQDLKFGSKGNTYYHISRSLCALCRELDVPVISLVPINPTSKVPQLSLFITLGNLDQNADVVIFLMRSDHDKLTPLVAKHRNGNISDIYCQSSSEATTKL